MDTLQDKAPAQPGLTDWREQFDALRHLVVSVMVLLLVVSGTLNLFLWKQWMGPRRELDKLRPQSAQIAQMAAEIQKVEIPIMQDFLKKFTEFGRTHPDFRPILDKYGLKPAGPAPAASTAATPSPAAQPKAKK
jgi:hypothetical protein